MKAFTTHKGIAAPLRRSNVDTDQIIPATYLKSVKRTGFENALFESWRSNEPDFVLNNPIYHSASVLVAGPDFGTGSSREHAVWALNDYGFRVVFSSRFADIFRNNSGKQGLLAGVLEQAEIEEIWQWLDEYPGAEITIHLEDNEVIVGDKVYHFEVDPYIKHRLLNGLDDIDLTLQNEVEIADFEAKRPEFKPKTLPAKTEGEAEVISAQYDTRSPIDNQVGVS